MGLIFLIDISADSSLMGRLFDRYNTRNLIIFFIKTQFDRVGDGASTSRDSTILLH